MTDAELIDFTKLVTERTRKAFMTVGQLIEDDTVRGAMLLGVAADFVRGAAETLRDIKPEITEDLALKTTIAQLMQVLEIIEFGPDGARLKKVVSGEHK